MKFTDGVFAHFLQRSYKNLIAEEGFYDVVLEADGKQYKAHKAVLAAASPYFRTMFTTKIFKEYNEELVKLHLVHPAALHAILQFIYTSTIEITDDNLFLLMSAVDLFAMSSLRICIAKYMAATMSPTTCLGHFVAADTFNYPELMENARRFVLMNFHLLVDSPELLDLPHDKLKDLISSPLLSVHDESKLAQSVLQWGSARDGEQGRERTRHLPELMSCIRIDQFSLDLQSRLKNGKKQLDWWMDEFLRLRQGQATISGQRYCYEQVVTMAIGGIISGFPSRTAECFTLGYDSWLSSIPKNVVEGAARTDTRVITVMKSPRSDAAVAHDRYNVYVIGGTDGVRVLESCECYSVTTNTWRQLPSLPYPMEGCSAATCDRKLFVSGGLGCTDMLALLLSGKKGLEWQTLPPLPQARHHHCMVATNGFVFVLGGYLNEETVPTATVMRYDVTLRSWMELPPMICGRALFGAAVLDSVIYVMGGKNGDSALQSVERYDLLTNEWASMRDMLSPRYHFSVTVADNRIFCLGGSTSNHELHTVDKYNPWIDRWHPMSSMQVTRSGLAAASVYVPVVNPPNI